MIDTNIQTRKYFARINVRCIRNAINGIDKIKDIEGYIRWRREDIRNILMGKYDHTFTHRQYKHYIETGKCIPFMR